MTGRVDFEALNAALVDARASLAESRVVQLVAQKCGLELGALSIREIVELSQLSKQSVLDGIAAALEHGFIDRDCSSEPYSYAIAPRFAVRKRR